jgi:hypothetical protein
MANIIRSYFETKLKNFADAQNPPIAVSFEGVPFTKPDDAPYLECFLMNSKTLNPNLGGIRTRQIGLFQINVVVIDGSGSKQVDDLVQNIIALYPVVPKDSPVSVEQTPNSGRAIVDNSGRRYVPITVKYRYDS